MKLGPFIAGAFGVVGFALSMIAGLVADNAVESILIKALLAAIACYGIGYVVGMAADQVSREHADAIARKVADADAEDERRKLQDAADNAQPEPGAGAATPATIPAAMPASPASG